MIVGAKSILTTWILHINFSDINNENMGNLAGTESWATRSSMDLEEKFLDKMAHLKEFLEKNASIKIYYSAARSYGDISSKTLFQDIDKVICGTLLMMIYMTLVLSKWSWIELRPLLTAQGLINVGMAYISGCGIASSYFHYTPVHTSLFFIILGLGVDDIFVIMAALRKVKTEHPDLELPEKIGKALEESGAAITITSVTDILAFMVGGTTVLPSLQSFCIYASLCILMTYIFVVTFFVACLTLDERRIQSKKNGVFPCITHHGSKIWTEPNLLTKFITFIYSKIVLNKGGKVVVILIAVTLSTFSFEKVFQIKQKFDPMWFVPAHNQYFEYAMEYRKLYPHRSYEAAIFMGSLNYTSQFPKILKLSEEIRNQSSILGQVTSWSEPFKEFVQEFYTIDISQVSLSDTQFKVYLSNFLFSAQGGQYQANFKFVKPLVCGDPAPEIKISSISFNFHRFEDRDEYLPAKKQIETIIEFAQIDAPSGHVFLWSRMFSTWLTDEIIDEEIFRNLTLALCGVFLCTIVMIVNPTTCFFIFLCVLMSMVTVGGFMQIWGLTLDLVTCISLQLSVGLCIDSAAHIGHTFLTTKESDGGNLRALRTMQIVGGAVWQGGGSTMLAVSLLAFSDAYTYQTFFKVFTVVIMCSVFYGTFFLPVVLSIFEPKPYAKAATKNRRQHHELEICQREGEPLRKNDNGQQNCDNNTDTVRSNES